MNHTETITTSYGQRVGNSIKGVVFGIILIIGGVILLGWNEGRTIKVTEGLKEGEKITVNGSTSPIDTSLEGKLVYVNGKAETKDVLSDKVFFIEENAIKIRRKVEMYQWEEDKETKTHDNVGGSETTTTTYSYEKVWDENKINSSSFSEAGHENPSNRKFESFNLASDNVKIGDIKLGQNFVTKIDNEQPVSLNEEMFNKFKTTQKINNAKLENNAIYIGDGNINNPSVGDIKITFYAVYPATVSAIGQQQGNVLFGYTTNAGTTIDLIEYGDITINQMYLRAHDDNKLLARILRGVGLLILFIGFTLIFGIIVTLAKVLPFLANIISFGTGLISFLLTVIIGGLVIILSWIFVRPIISIIVLMIVGLIVYITVKLKKKKESDGNNFGRIPNPEQGSPTNI